ncbi:hypothetical protein [Sporisorium scitamineum]|uniref:Uncharacterized protein n=1 Tax=Sporisorium scitamineum TaxID=49012 RepID=A0A0F7S2I6_9BASI|nr:hypothetical protein [Sporisorium scitamineum]
MAMQTSSDVTCQWSASVFGNTVMKCLVKALPHPRSSSPHMNACLLVADHLDASSFAWNYI